MGNPLCLGCGKPAGRAATICDACEIAEVAHADTYGWWPLAIHATPPALHAIEMGIRAHLFTPEGSGLPEPVVSEIIDVANAIRAYLQHLAADRIAVRKAATPTDEDLLS